MKEKNEKVQILRAMSIIAVVMIHSSSHSLPEDLVRPFLNFCVACFLFLSGYLTKLNYPDWTAFFKKRIIRVLIPYIIWSVIASLFYGVRNPSVILFRLITGGSSVQFYYIYVYIQFVLLTPFISRLALSRYRWIGWLIMPLATCVFKYYWVIQGTPINDFLRFVGSKSLLCWFSFYYLGILLGNKLLHVRVSNRKLFILYGVSILLNYVESYWLMSMGDQGAMTQNKFSSYLSSAIFILLAYRFINDERRQFQSRTLVLIGDYSFGIFLCHVIVMELLKSYLPLYNSLPYVINSLLIVFVCCVFIFIARRVLGERICRFIGL